MFSGFLFDFSFTVMTCMFETMFGLHGASVELVRVRASTYGARKRTAALLDRETGPDLTWQPEL